MATADGQPVMALPADELTPRHDIPRGGRSGFLLVDGRQVHYLEWGHRGLPPVVCLHGGGQTAYMFEELGDALKERYHLFAPDLPSHGDSDPLPDDDMEFGRHGTARSLVPVLDQVGIERAAFVGASYGGITSITLGAAQPERVASIALIDVGHRLEPEGVQRIVEFMGAHESFASLEEAAREIAPYLPHRREVRPENLRRNLRQRADGRWEWKHGFGRRMRAREAAGESTDVDAAAVLGGLDEDAARLVCPVLVLRGAFSDVLSDQGAEEIAAIIPDARLRTVQRAGHLAAGDNPESTIGHISAFLAETDW